MNAFWKLSSGFARIVSAASALFAALLVFAAGPDQAAGLFGVIILLAIVSSTSWAAADWMTRKAWPGLRQEMETS